MDTNGGNKEAPSSSKPGSKKRMSGPDSDSEDKDDKSHKRTKLLECHTPWFTDPGQSTTHSSNPSCQETCRLLQAYNQDIAKAKFFIKIAPNSPSGIPALQWKGILKGETVNLNQIFLSLHNIIPDEENRSLQRHGNQFWSCRSKEENMDNIRRVLSVETSFKSHCLRFFPPLTRGTQWEYGDYIDSEFAAKLSSSHPRVILYDVGTKLLTNIHR